MANAASPNQFESEGAEPRASQPGPVPAARFVQTIHDGIEFALSQLVLETFDLLKRALVLTDAELREATKAWEISALNSCLHSEAARWIAHVSRELAVPTPTIDAAAGLRTLSELEKQNDIATTLFRQPLGHFGDDAASVLDELRHALCAAIIITYAEGLALLAKGPEQYGFGLDLAEVVRLWKEGHSVRATLLEEIASAIQATPNLPNLLDDDDLSEKVMEHQESLRHAVWRAGLMQTSVPTLTASLDYLDSYRGAWLPVNLIQAPPARFTPPLPAVLVRR